MAAEHSVSSRPLTWREKCVIKILLLVTAIVANGVEHLEGNRELAAEIRHLANHISTWAPKGDE